MKCRARTNRRTRCGQEVVPELLVCIDHATKEALLMLIKEQQRAIQHLQACLNRGGT